MRRSLSSTLAWTYGTSRSLWTLTSGALASVFSSVKWGWNMYTGRETQGVLEATTAGWSWGPGQ